MPTKIFSGRVDEQKLAYAEAIAQKEAGMSFGQYCSSTVVDYINAIGSLPIVEVHDDRQEALDRLFEIIDSQEPSPLGPLSDEDVRELIASRYE